MLRVAILLAYRIYLYHLTTFIRKKTTTNLSKTNCIDQVIFLEYQRMNMEGNPLKSSVEDYTQEQ